MLTRTTYILSAGVVMSLGWGLRGYIGGGPLGAMIPGALTGLFFILALKIRGRQAAVLAAACTAGIGFGGQMTYGQTVGFLGRPETFLWAITGLGVKGAVWGLLGGAMAGLALLPARRSWYGLIALPPAVWLGWKLVNEPKLIYFSNRESQPRAEIWAGLLLGAIVLLAVAGWCGALLTPLRVALGGAVGGGIGFPLGGALMTFGRSLPVDHRWFDWWKQMEFSFGFCLGVGLAVAIWQLRDEISRGEPTDSLPVPPWSIAVAVLLCVVPIGGEWNDFLNFGYTVSGTLLVAVALFWPWAGWHTAVTVTSAAFLSDLAEHGVGRGGFQPTLVWIAAALAALRVALAVVKWTPCGDGVVRPAFFLLLWLSVADSWAKSFLYPWPWRGHLITQLVFTAAALWLTLRLRPVAAAYCASPRSVSQNSGNDTDAASAV